MRKHKIYLGKRHHHKPVPRLLKQAAINAYAGEVERYINLFNEHQVLKSARSPGKSTVIASLFAPVSVLNALKDGSLPVTLGLFATKLPTPHWSRQVPTDPPFVDMDVTFMYPVEIKHQPLTPNT